MCIFALEALGVVADIGISLSQFLIGKSLEHGIEFIKIDRSLKEETPLDETIVFGRQDLDAGHGMPISLSSAGKPRRLVVEKTIGQFAVPGANNVANLLRVALDVVQKAAGSLSSSRWLAKLTVAGIAEPVEVFQIMRNLDDDWAALAKGYQLALAEYDNQ